MKIASIVENLSMSQNTFWMTKTFNQLNKYDIHPSCFYINLGSTGIKMNFPNMNVYYASNFSDTTKPILISTSLKTLEVSMNLKINARRMLYLWDIEWLRLTTSSLFSYNKNVDLLRNKNIELIARSSNHANVISNYCNREIDFIIDDWNIQDIRGLYEQRTK